jgi:hypothetical protein
MSATTTCFASIGCRAAAPGELPIAERTVLIGFVVGKVSATFWAPVFPNYVLLESGDAARGLAALLICALASTLAIRAALKIDPAAAIGG